MNGDAAAGELVQHRRGGSARRAPRPRAGRTAGPARRRPCRRCSGRCRRRRRACSRAPPRAAARGGRRQSANTESSSPSSSSSITTRPAERRGARAAPASSSSCVRQTKTPLPAASPSALTTHGGAGDRQRPRRSGRRPRPARPWRSSSSPRSAPPPRSARRRRRRRGAARRRRRRRAAPPARPRRGRSRAPARARAGPRASSARTGWQVPSAAIPGFPGAACSSSSSALWRSFHASACSRPPEPTMSTRTRRVYETGQRATLRSWPSATRRARRRRTARRASRCVRLPGGEVERDVVAVEEPLEIRIGGAPVAVTMRTPGHDEELALGFCLSEGLQPARARLPDDLAANAVEVDAPGFDPERLRRSFYTSSSCGVCGKGALEAVAVEAPRVESALTRRRRARRRAARPAAGGAGRLRGDRRPARDRPLRRRRASCSACARTSAGTTPSTRCVGWAFTKGCLPLADSLLCVSGRLSFELVQKAAVAGCPILVAVGAPSSLAVELAARPRDHALRLRPRRPGERLHGAVADRG